MSDTRTLATDTSGHYLDEALQAAGHTLADRQILSDDITRSAPWFRAGLPINT